MYGGVKPRELGPAIDTKVVVKDDDSEEAQVEAAHERVHDRLLFQAGRDGQQVALRLWRVVGRAAAARGRWTTGHVSDASATADACSAIRARAALACSADRARDCVGAGPSSASWAGTRRALAKTRTARHTAPTQPRGADVGARASALVRRACCRSCTSSASAALSALRACCKSPEGEQPEGSACAVTRRGAARVGGLARRTLQAL